jgi:L-alanine-DL-glutamate epimerase-like enolase superfamily enzyme
MKIRELNCFQVSGPAHVDAFEERQLQMLDIYPELARRGPAGATERVTDTYVEVIAEDGTTGQFGPIFDETAPIVLAKLAPHVVGQDALAYERLWDVLYRQDRHARKGYEMMAISAVDCAVWDLRGKLLGLPVYRLLGGPTRRAIECYASMLGHSLDLGLVRARARATVEHGFKAQKWLFRYGPSDGLGTRPPRVRGWVIHFGRVPGPLCRKKFGRQAAVGPGRSRPNFWTACSATWTWCARCARRSARRSRSCSTVSWAAT